MNDCACLRSLGRGCPECHREHGEHTPECSVPRSWGLVFTRKSPEGNTNTEVVLKR